MLRRTTTFGGCIPSPKFFLRHPSSILQCTNLLSFALPLLLDPQRHQHSTSSSSSSIISRFKNNNLKNNNHNHNIFNNTSSSTSCVASNTSIVRYSSSTPPSSPPSPFTKKVYGMLLESLEQNSPSWTDEQKKFLQEWASYLSLPDALNPNNDNNETEYKKVAFWCADWSSTNDPNRVSENDFSGGVFSLCSSSSNNPSSWANLVYVTHPAFLKNTLLPLVKEAHGNAKRKNITFKEFVEDKKQNFVGVPFTFACLPNCDLPNFDTRHVDVPLYLPEELLKDIKEIFTDPHYIMPIIGGASGVGKTVCSFQAAKYLDKAAKVIYFQCSDALATEQLDKTTKKPLDAETRNKIAFDLVLESVTALVSELVLAPDNTNYPIVVVFDEIGASPLFLRSLCHLAQELGVRLENTLLRCGKEPLREVDDPWKRESKFNATSQRVRFIAAGTGANFGPVYGEAGSNVNTYRMVHLARKSDYHSNKIFAHLVDKCSQIDSNDKFHLPQDVVPFLKRLQHGFVPNENGGTELETTPRSLIEQDAADLVTNARAAALFLKFVSENVSATSPSEPLRTSSRLCWNSLASFNLLLPGLLQSTVISYISKNGLKHATYPMARIVAATAACLYRLPFLPIGRASVNDLNSDPWKFLDSNFLNKLLITKGGVLTDDAELGAYDELTTAESAIDITDYLPAEMKPDGATAKLLLKSDTVNRYSETTTFLAMLRQSLAINYRHAANHRAFEQQIADFCMICIACSYPAFVFFNGTLSKEEKGQECFKTYENHRELLGKFDKDINSKCDPLWRFKSLLRFETPLIKNEETTPHVTKGECFQIVNSPLNSVFHMLAYASEKKNDATAEQKAQAFNNSRLAEHSILANEAIQRLNELHERIKSLIADGNAVVLMSQDMESHADVIVAGPEKMIFIQMKQLLYEGPLQQPSSSSVDWMGELSKCGLLVKPAYLRNATSKVYKFDTTDDETNKKIVAIGSSLSSESKWKDDENDVAVKTKLEKLFGNTAGMSSDKISRYYNVRMMLLEVLADACVNYNNNTNKINLNENYLLQANNPKLLNFTKPNNLKIHFAFVVEASRERMTNIREDFKSSFRIANSNSTPSPTTAPVKNVADLTRLERQEKENLSYSFTQLEKMIVLRKDRKSNEEISATVSSKILDSIDLVAIVREKDDLISKKDSSYQSSLLFPLRHSSVMPSKSAVMESVGKFDVDSLLMAIQTSNNTLNEKKNSNNNNNNNNNTSHQE